MFIIIIIIIITRLTSFVSSYDVRRIKIQSHRQKRLEQEDEPSNRSDDRCVESFEIISQIGEGTYGQVYKAKDKDTG